MPIDRGDWPEGEGADDEVEHVDDAGVVHLVPRQRRWTTPCTTYDVGVLSGLVVRFAELGREATIDSHRHAFAKASQIADTLAVLRTRVINAVINMPPVEAVAELRRVLELPERGGRR